jgi:hypothetical protein
MLVVGERRVAVRPKLDEVEQLRQMVAIQTQIVQLAKQNELTQKECEVLREELSRRMRPDPSRGSAFSRLLRAVLRQLKRNWKSHAQGH